MLPFPLLLLLVVAIPQALAVIGDLVQSLRVYYICRWLSTAYLISNRYILLSLYIDFRRIWSLMCKFQIVYIKYWCFAWKKVSTFNRSIQK